MTRRHTAGLATTLFALAAALPFWATVNAQPAPATATIDVLPVHGQVFLLAGPATNALVQVGPDGVLVVDTMREQDADQLLAAIRKLAPGKTIRYVLNTHAHLDHVGGNQTISTAGTLPTTREAVTPNWTVPKIRAPRAAAAVSGTACVKSVPTNWPALSSG